MLVKGGRPPHRLTGVVDDEVQPILCPEQLATKRFHARRVAQIEPEHGEAVAPRGEIGFLGVSRRGVVLIEPIEGPRRPLEFVRALAKMTLRRRSPIYDLFEPSGNFIYRVSQRDVFRMLTALEIPWFAIKTFNTFYLGWLAAQSRTSLVARAIFRLGIGLQDFLCFCRLMNPGLCVIFVPTEQDPQPVRDILKKARFRIIATPKNPYTSAPTATASA